MPLIWLINDGARIVLGLVALGAIVSWWVAADVAWKADTKERAALTISAESLATRARTAAKLVIYASRAEQLGNTSPDLDKREAFIAEAKALIEEVAGTIAPMLPAAETADVMAIEPHPGSFQGSPVVSALRNRLLGMASKLRALARTYTD